MSYERQRNVQDGEEVIKRDDIDERCPTKGPLVHGKDGDDIASPIRINNENELLTSDTEVIHLLQKILKELKKINIYNSMTHDQEIDNSEIEGE